MTSQFDWSSIGCCGAECCQMCAHKRTTNTPTDTALCTACDKMVPCTSLQSCSACAHSICVVCRLRSLYDTRQLVTAPMFRSFEQFAASTDAKCPSCKIVLPRHDLLQLHMHYQLHKQALNFKLMDDSPPRQRRIVLSGSRVNLVTFRSHRRRPIGVLQRRMGMHQRTLPARNAPLRSPSNTDNNTGTPTNNTTSQPLNLSPSTSQSIDLTTAVERSATPTSTGTDPTSQSTNTNSSMTTNAPTTNTISQSAVTSTTTSSFTSTSVSQSPSSSHSHTSTQIVSYNVTTDLEHDTHLQIQHNTINQMHSTNYE